MPDLAALRLGGDVLTVGSPGYEAVRAPVDPRFSDARPRAVVRCRSGADVAAVLGYAAATGERLAVRGGGHCFAGRSSTEGVVLDLAGLGGVAVGDDGIATIGGGVRLGPLYEALHGRGRSLPAGCGATVGIGGLTLGGGIGLLGRRYGLTCDRLVGAQVVLADGSTVDCDRDTSPDLFWALRGAGGAQFGVVTSFRFDTVAEPLTTRIGIRSPAEPADVIEAWQAWAPDAPDEVSLNLTVIAERGLPVAVHVLGASMLDSGSTAEVLREFAARIGAADVLVLRGDVPYHRLKRDFPDSWVPPALPRQRSEFFAGRLARTTVRTLLDLLAEPGGTSRRVTFTAMGGAYNRVPEAATAFAHRGARFLLEHVGETCDPWVDRSWSAAHPEGSGRVYPNFPDPLLDDPAAAYHAGNYARLVAVKQRYDPNRLFDFPQAIRSSGGQT